jgi:hypothetical protein
LWTGLLLIFLFEMFTKRLLMCCKNSNVQWTPNMVYYTCPNTVTMPSACRLYTYPSVMWTLSQWILEPRSCFYF